jgi:hypothetical protein
MAWTHMEIYKTAALLRRWRLVSGDLFDSYHMLAALSRLTPEQVWSKR